MVKNIQDIINNNDFGNTNRLKYFEYIIPKLISKNKPIYIIETGSMHVDEQGAFTKIMSYLIKNITGGKLTTIDISEEHMNKCKEYTKEYSDVIEYITSDSVEYLSSLSMDEVKKIDLFYFDSLDINLKNPKPSQIHHLKELLAVYDKLKNDVILSVDDNYLPNCWIQWIWSNGETEIINTENKILGKGTYINNFLLFDNWKRLEELETYPECNVFVFEK